MGYPSDGVSTEIGAENKESSTKKRCEGLSRESERTLPIKSSIISVVNVSFGGETLTVLSVVGVRSSSWSLS